MTTRPNVPTSHSPGFLRLPDPPEPEDMNNNIFLHLPGNSHHLAMHFGHPDTTIIAGEAYISQEPTGERLGLLAPDLLIAFNVNPAASAARNGYVISEQGKPPDFLLEIASASTGRRDVTVKRGGVRRPGDTGITGGSTTLGDGTTACPWLGTGWWRGHIKPYPSR